MGACKSQGLAPLATVFRRYAARKYWAVAGKRPAGRLLCYARNRNFPGPAPPSIMVLMLGRSLKAARRLHASTWIVSACTFLALLLANLTAQIIVEPELFSPGKYGPHFQCGTHYEHGWPASFVSREANRWQPTIGFRPVSRWKIHEDVIRFSLGQLYADLAVGAALLAFVTLGFDAWRQRRRSVFQWHLKDVFAAVAAMCLFFGWLAAERAAFQSELECLKVMDEVGRKNHLDAPPPPTPLEESAEWQRGGPWWLRSLLGDRCFRQFDRVVRIDLEPGQVRYAPRLKYLKAVSLFGSDFNADDLAALKQLTDLIAVDAMYCYAQVEDEFEEDGDHSTDPVLAVLSTLPQLKGINLYEAGISSEGLKQLRALRGLQVLDLSDTDATDEGLACLESMSDLRILSLASAKLTDAGMRHFSRLSQLEELWLHSPDITDAGLAMLPPMPRLRNLSLSAGPFTFS